MVAQACNPTLKRWRRREIPSAHSKLPVWNRYSEMDTNINLWLSWVLTHVHMGACMYTPKHMHTKTHTKSF